MRPDHALFQSAIIQAVIEADQRETKMKGLNEEEYYSPHIMVRMGSIPEIRAMLSQLEPQLGKLYSAGVLINAGWSPTAIYQGHDRQKKYEKKIDPDEKDLSAKTRDGKYRHPFMAAKNNSGRCVANSKRILLMCKIGVRGINNWPIDTVVDCAGTSSKIDIIQLLFGRPIRWPRHLAHWIGNERYAEFASGRIYIPSTSTADAKFSDIEETREFVVNMLERVGQAGFLTWQQLLDEEDIDKDGVNIDAVGVPLTQIQKYQIQGALADICVHHIPNEDEVEPTITCLFPTFGPSADRKGC